MIRNLFIKCMCRRLVIGLDIVISYDNLYNVLKRYIKTRDVNFELCDIGLSRRVESSAEVCYFEKVLSSTKSKLDMHNFYFRVHIVFIV